MSRRNEIVLAMLVSAAVAAIQAAGTSRSEFSGSENQTETAATRAMPAKRVVLHVAVIDYAGANIKTVAKALKVAERIFEDCGVELNWKFIGRKQAEEAELAGVAYFVRLLPNHLTRTTASTPNAMGSAAGRLADAYYENIWLASESQRFGPAAAKRVPVFVLLGHVIAHELGHLLLGPRNHSAGGIMRADWNHNGAMPEIRADCLFFTKEQASRIRQRLANNRREIAGGSGLSGNLPSAK